MRIDLNADVGEAVGQDPALMPHITSANVACGVHAGVAVGAHPSFPDREGFGRRDLQLPPWQIEELVVSQIAALAAIASAEGMRLQHVKPHGALFNVAVRDRSVADAIARATASVDPALILFGLPASELIAAGKAAGLQTASEAFADRAYRPDGTLVPRTQPGAVIDDAAQVLTRVAAMARDRAVIAIDGTRVPITLDTICVHGDTPGAADLAARIRSTLAASGIDVKSIGQP
jgi:5-oxoprolinase (ATP-hydrolysing) subunit A